MEGLMPTMVGKVQNIASGVVGEITTGAGICEKCLYNPGDLN
jgi:hypothetical protein